MPPPLCYVTEVTYEYNPPSMTHYHIVTASLIIHTPQPPTLYLPFSPHPLPSTPTFHSHPPPLTFHSPVSTLCSLVSIVLWSILVTPAQYNKLGAQNFAPFIGFWKCLTALKFIKQDFCICF